MATSAQFQPDPFAGVLGLSRGGGLHAGVAEGVVFSLRDTATLQQYLSASGVERLRFLLEQAQLLDQRLRNQPLGAASAGLFQLSDLERGERDRRFSGMLNGRRSATAAQALIDELLHMRLHAYPSALEAAASFMLSLQLSRKEQLRAGLDRAWRDGTSRLLARDDDGRAAARRYVLAAYPQVTLPALARDTHRTPATLLRFLQVSGRTVPQHWHCRDVSAWLGLQRIGQAADSARTLLEDCVDLSYNNISAAGTIEFLRRGGESERACWYERGDPQFLKLLQGFCAGQGHSSGRDNDYWFLEELLQTGPTRFRLAHLSVF